MNLKSVPRTGNLHFLLLLQCFVPFQRQKSYFRRIDFVIFKCLRLAYSKILKFDES